MKLFLQPLLMMKFWNKRWTRTLGGWEGEINKWLFLDQFITSIHFDRLNDF